MNKLRRIRRPLGTFMLALLAHWQVTQPLQAATVYWDGSTDVTWGQAANWNTQADGLGANVTFANGNDLVFIATGGINLTTTLGAARTVRSLTFNSTLTSPLAINNDGTNARTLTITPTGIGLTPAGIGIDMTSSGADVSIGASTITLGADQTWLLGAGRTLTVTSGFTTDATDDLIIDGAGTFRLGNTTDNVYNINTVTLQNGATMVNTQDNAFGDTTTTIIMNAGTFWDKGGFGDSFRGLSGTGTVTNAGNFDFRSVAGDTFTFSGTASGPATADILKQGQTQYGTQIIAGDISFQDQINVFSGTLAFANTNGAANLITGTILIGRSDNQTVRDATNSLSTLRLDSTLNNHVAGNRLHNDEPVLMRSSGHLEIRGNALAATTENIGLINIEESNGADANGIITLQDGGAGVELSSDSLTRSAGGTLLVRGTGLGTGALGAGVTRLLFDITAPTITGTAGTTNVGIIPGVIADNSFTGTGAGLATYGTDGVRLLTAAEYGSTFAGTGENIKLTANQTLAGPTTDLTATLEAATLDLGSSSLTLSNASIYSGGAGANTITNGSINFGAATEGFIYTAQDLTLSAAITGATALTKAGAGKLTLSAPQTYTGITSITQGTVDVAGNFTLPATRLNVDNATLNFTGTSDYNRVGFLTGSWNSTVNLGTNTLELVGLGADNSYYGQLNGAAGATLVKTGGNVWSQRSLNSSYLGAVIVRGGTFRLVGDSSTATSPAAGTLTGAASWLVETGGTLLLENQTATDNRAISDRIGNAATVTLNRGIFAITGNNNARPSETIGAVTLQGGYNTITLDADFGANTASNTSHGDVVLTAASLTRNNSATALVRGDNLGFLIGGTADTTAAANTTGGNAGDPGGSESNFIITAAPTLSGAGTGAAIGFVPYLTGGVTAASAGDSLITTSANGLRLLDFSPTTTDYSYLGVAANANLLSATISGNNVLIDITANNADAVLDASATIGGLLIRNAGGTGSDLNLNGNTLTVAGGTILSTGANDNDILANGSITFGPNAVTNYEGRIHGVRRINIAVPITDNAGNAVSLTTDGDVYLLTPSTYTGPTVINSGRIEISGVNDGLPTGTVLTVNGAGALRLFGGNQQISGLQGVGFVENENTIANPRTLTINNGLDYTFEGVLRNSTGAPVGVLNLVKQGAGTQTLAGRTASTATGTYSIQEGRLALDGGMTANSGQTYSDNRIPAAAVVTLGSVSTSGTLQIGGATRQLNQTLASLSTIGSGSAVVGGNATTSLLTINQSVNTSFVGNLGGAGTNENSLSITKSDVGELAVTGNATYTGTTTVTGGKLSLTGSHNLPGALSVSNGELRISGTNLLGTAAGNITINNGGSLIFNGGNANQTFSGSGNVLTLNQSSSTTQLGFGLSGGTSDRLTLGSGQTLSITGLIDTVIVVGAAPTVLTDRGYLLIDSAVDGAFTGTGSFQIGAIENAGNFIYNVARESVGTDADRLYLTVTANTTPPPNDAWWKGDLTGPAAGSWTAVQLGGSSNWDTSETGGIDAAVPPGSNSHVHFSATGAANFATQLLSPLTIKALTFHTGSGTNGVTVGGTGILTLGNGVDTPSLDVQTGGNAAITVSAPIALGASQAWNIADAGSVLTVSGGISGTGDLSVNSNGSSLGTLLLRGASSTFVGNTTVAAGRLILEGTDRLPTSGSLTLGSASAGAVLQLGNATSAGSTQITGISEGAFGGNSIVGGNATASILTIHQATATTLGAVIGGAGTNENNLGLTKNGAGTLTLNGANTYTGSTTINEGVVRLGSTGSLNGSNALVINAATGGTTSLDINGRTAVLTGGITLGGVDGSAIPSIIDTATGGLLTLGGNVIYNNANGPGGAIISANLANGGSPRTFTVNDSALVADDLTFNGTYASTNSATVDGAGHMVVNGAWTLTGTDLGLNKNGIGTLTVNAITNTTGAGDWNINGGTVNATVTNALNAADDVIITGTSIPNSVVVNISGTAGTSGVHQGDDFFIRAGGRANVSVTNGISTGTDSLLVGDSGSTAAAGVLNLDTVNISVGTNGLILGGAGGNVGQILGAGIITTTGGFSLRNGSIEAGIELSGGGLTKVSDGTVTFSGTRTAGNTAIQEGSLVLDYTSNVASKIAGVLTLGTASGGFTAPTSLTLDGNIGSAVVQSVTSTTVSNTGDVSVNINDVGAGTTLALGAITRNQGTVSFSYSGGSAAATTTNADTGALGWATVATGGTTRIAAISGGNIIQSTTATQNNVADWAVGANIINSAAYTGTVGPCNVISSLTFDAAAASTVTIGSDNLVITSGGILVNSGVGANTSLITGGKLLGATSGTAGEIIIHQNNTAAPLNIASSITNSGGLTKSGNGILELSGANTFAATSRLTINEGTVRVSGGRAVGDSTILMMRNGATFDVGTSQETIGNIGVDGTNIASGTINIGAGGVLTVNQVTTATFSGLFTGNGTIVKQGGGNLNLTGSTTTGFTGTVIVNNGLLQLSGSAGRLANATAFTINKGGNLLIDNNDDASVTTRISDTASITLNSADGAFSGTVAPRGLAIRDDDNATGSETFGALTIASGASYVTVENGTGASSITALAASGWTRNAGATMNVRGENLGVATGIRGQFKIIDANDTTFLASTNLIGGTGIAGSVTRKIIPWAIGEQLGSTNLADGNMGNTLLTYVDNAGVVPLNLATEYATFATRTTAEDNIRESLTADLTGITGNTINALVIHNASAAASALNVTGTAGTTLANTSGAFLFTLNPAAAASSAHSVTLGGFDAITTAGSEYVFHVVNPSAVATTPTLTAIVSSPLTSAAALVKSGRGTLSLTGLNTHTGNNYINEGILQITDLDNLGTGAIHFSGGTLRLAAAFTDDASSRGWTINSGGGSLDASLVTNGTTLANGLLDATPSVSDTLNIFTRATLTGTDGQLTLQGASTFTGTTLFRNSTQSLSGTALNSVVLSGSTGTTINGNVEIGDLVNVNNNGDVVVALGASDQIVDTATITFRGASGENSYFKLAGFNETVAGIIDSSGNGVIQNAETDTLSASGTLTLNSSNDYSYNGFMRDVSTGLADANSLSLTKQGTGTQTLSGANIRHSGATTVSAGGLSLVDVTNWQSAITNNGQLTLTQTAARNHSQVISGTGNLTKLGTAVLTLSGANTYSGVTSIEQGTLSVSASNNLGDASATNTLRLGYGAILQSTGASVDLGANRAIALVGGGGSVEVTGANLLTLPGIISGDDCHTLAKTSTGTLILTGANTYEGATSVLGGVLQVGVAGVGQSGSGAMTVASSSGLSGTGLVRASTLSLASGAILTPGDGTATADLGTLTFTPTTTGAYDLATGSVINLGISTPDVTDPTFGGNAPGSAGYFTWLDTLTTTGAHDRLIFNGTAGSTLTFSSTVNVLGTGAFSPANGQIYNLVDWMNLVTANFAGFTAGANRDGSGDTGSQFDLPDISSNGLSWDTSAFTSHGVIAVVGVVPEPSRALLLLVGLLSLGLRRRRAV